MSATNATTNYNFTLFIGTDKPAWLVDWNSAMSAIDAAIKGVDTDVQGAIVDISGLSSTVAAHTASISTISGQITVITTNLNTATGNINTINSLIGNGTPTTTDQTIIGAINELHADQGDLADLTTPAVSLVAATNAISGGGAVAANAVSYSNTVSGLTATNVQAAIDEVVAAIPSAGAVELKRGTLTAGQTSVTLTFAVQAIGATSLVDVYVEDGIHYSAIATTSTTVTLTFPVQAANKAVAVRVTN
jgi:hypothetical protein